VVFNKLRTNNFIPITLRINPPRVPNPWRVRKVKKFFDMLKLDKETTEVEVRGKRRKKNDKGVWRMPRLSKAKKDVISCEKPRGPANTA
jgi:hypothetical protein